MIEIKTDYETWNINDLKAESNELSATILKMKLRVEKVMSDKKLFGKEYNEDWFRRIGGAIRIYKYKNEKCLEAIKNYEKLHKKRPEIETDFFFFRKACKELLSEEQYIKIQELKNILKNNNKND